MEQVRRAIARLPRPQRETVELCVFAGLGHQAAAIAMGVSVGTVKSRLHRARQQLASELQMVAHEPDLAGPVSREAR
jgi:RNA polymerase sigma factor (sigma-70 family)